MLFIYIFSVIGMIPIVIVWSVIFIEVWLSLANYLFNRSYHNKITQFIAVSDMKYGTTVIVGCLVLMPFVGVLLCPIIWKVFLEGIAEYNNR